MDGLGDRDLPQPSLTGATTASRIVVDQRTAPDTVDRRSTDIRRQGLAPGALGIPVLMLSQPILIIRTVGDHLVDQG